ncbi:hypothetical protein [Cutibacterium modestum]|uniref:Uncharacterized protein n=1 Tax=Cutibacterium modestum HL044PA1 TaxID=765109 RepID=A0ABN0C2N2_9ACTN|nr:hypothetical protein [Cutibacterium modestum]EFS73875.1 hypothetical protein HMPREF9621_01710 [Cutibacterium modestum HL037PA2]EFS91429.1 hypothetical protein HMPREF9607_02334 [Cutibacterium modestum HL044PA1]EFT15503.1 hypothetical protein HMPREF9622_01504 [Cutibacterium modestum HL037PA3]EGG26115.1 hypothetical protein PA08_2080 [Cutibacterium modestum P08]
MGENLPEEFSDTAAAVVSVIDPVLDRLDDGAVGTPSNGVG